MLKDLINQNNFVFKKKWGQNFITDTNLLSNIVDLGGFESGDEILEIGAGAGTLTLQLSKRFQKVVAYEIDKTLAPILQEFLKDCKNIKLVYEDILKAEISEIEKNFKGEYCIVANLPYYITTPIIFKFLNEATKLKSIYVMVQKEVALRVCAKAGDENYGVLTISVDSLGDAKITKHISRHMFYPPPNVDSAMIKIDINKDKYKIKDYIKFNKLVAAAFAMRRKTLVNNLSAEYKIDKEKIKEMIAKLGFDENVRGEQLTTTDYIKLLELI